MNIENWRPVKGFEGKYEVSDLGRIRSVERKAKMKNRWGLCEITVPERILSHGKTRTGHIRVTLYSGEPSKPSRHFVHQLVLKAFVGESPAGTEGSHLNGNPSDNRCTNLAWETPRDNNARKHQHGTAQIGEKNSTAKLTFDDVKQIRGLNGRMKQVEIANLFGVTQAQVSNILRGNQWRHLPHGMAYPG